MSLDFEESREAIVRVIGPLSAAALVNGDFAEIFAAQLVLTEARISPNGNMRRNICVESEKVENEKIILALSSGYK